MNRYIENLNYSRDRRTQAAPAKTVTIYGVDEGEADRVIELPTTWAVCSVCNGEGKHVNPSIDAGGISAEQFHDDPDFAEDYFGGSYDVTCYRCNGRTTEAVVDWSGVDPDIVEAYDEQCRIDAELEAEHQAEIRMGA